MDADLEYIHLADLSRPHIPVSIDVATAKEEEPTESTQVITDGVEGVVVLTQTCNIVRSSKECPFIEVAPLDVSM